MMRQLLSRATRGLPRVTQQNHNLSSSQNYIQVTQDEKTGVATVYLNRKPVNSLNYEMLTELTLTLEKLDKTCRGIILASNMNTTFSAGLDIEEFYQPDRERLSAFWRSLQDMYLRLYGCSRPVIAAINGHAIAGGCFMTLLADYRIMTHGNYRIGVPETHLGITAPFWFIKQLENMVGHSKACRALQLGQLLSPEEALQFGIIDELSPHDQILNKAEEQAKKWISIPDQARQLTKLSMRKADIDYFLAHRESELESRVSQFMDDSTQEIIGRYLEALRNKKKEK